MKTHVGGLMALRLALGALVQIGALANGQECGRWVEVEGSRSRSNLAAVAYGHDRWVAVGEQGLAATSGDGWSWHDRPTGTSYELQGIATNGEVFVAVGGTARSQQSPFVVVGPGVILTTVDGVTWHEAILPAGSPGVGPLFGVNWGLGEFVAVGQNGVVLRSADGLRWTGPTVVPPPRFGFPADLNDVTWTGRQWVAVGARNQTGWVTSSLDGDTWVTAPDLFQNRLVAVAAGPDRVVAVERAGHLLVSETGTVWERLQEDWGSLEDVTWDGERFVVVGALMNPDAPAFTQVVTSRDGLVWSCDWDNSRTGYPTGLASNGCQLVTVGRGGTIGVSRDGESWSWPMPEFNRYVRAMAATPDGLLAVGELRPTWPGGWGPGPLPPEVAVSPDAVHYPWSALGHKISVGDIATDGSSFVLVGSYGSAGGILLSRDGVDWRRVEVGAAMEPLYAVTWGEPGYVAVGSPAATIAHSSDGEQWTLASYPWEAPKMRGMLLAVSG